MKKRIPFRGTWPAYMFSALLMVIGVIAIATDYRFSGQEVFAMGFVIVLFSAKRHGHLTSWRLPTRKP